MPRRKKQSIPEPIPFQLPPQSNAQRAAKRWLWILVTVFGATILILWAWATNIGLRSFSWNRTPEKQIVDNSKSAWQEIFNNESERIKKEQLKTEVKNAINQIMAGINTSTTSTVNTTSTINIPTSTTSSSPITTSTHPTTSTL